MLTPDMHLQCLSATADSLAYTTSFVTLSDVAEHCWGIMHLIFLARIYAKGC